MKRNAIIFIFFLSFVVYANSLSGSFIWDDQSFVAANTSIRSLRNLEYFFTNPRTTAVGELMGDVYRPITTLSFAVDYAIWKLDFFGYHLTNVIMHSLNGILVFLLLSLIFENFLFALVGSLIFATHPVQTEVVSWISGRSSVLFMFFYLISFIFYIRSGKESKRSFYVFSVFFFALSLFSKEMAVTLPLILMLYDLHFNGKFNIRKNISKYIPYFALVVFYILIRTMLLKTVGQFAGWGHPYHVFLTMTKVVADYIRISLFPVVLCAVGYEVPISRTIFDPKTLFCVGLLAAIIFSLFFMYRRSKIISFSISFFLIALLPVLNIIPIKALEADRFLYLPILGFCIIAAFIISRLDDRLKKGTRQNISAIALIIIFLLIAFYSLRTVVRNEDWKDQITIGTKTLEAFPESAWAMSTLGQNYLENDNYEEAIKYLEKAVVRAGSYDLAHNLLGMAYFKTHRYADAINEFKTALKLTEGAKVPIHDMLGVSYASLEMYDEAQRQFKIAIREDPAFVNAYLNLGRVYEIKGDLKDALALYLNSTVYTYESDYRSAISFIRIGDVYTKMKDTAHAKEYYLKARKAIGPNNEALQNIIDKKITNLPK